MQKDVINNDPLVGEVGSLYGTPQITVGEARSLYGTPQITVGEARSLYGTPQIGKFREVEVSEED
ncbi:hypothetical protein [Streptomyces marianii]|uniref:Uncharacterized protein n=1 Tax=Streptomyces marianii TaxID=1817406 RepID=A0A5R9ECW7_9ACTN|nr:hypothetical protein [Streptomyces marianii]TLQ47846.1 hypothetical protein FEF34_37440 [Streptomyces marianii]